MGDFQSTSKAAFTAVSIHARLAMGDLDGQDEDICRQGFNSRPSCDGRLMVGDSMFQPIGFQFTPVLRWATAEKLKVFYI